MHLRESRTSKFSGGACPRTPLGSKDLQAFGKYTRLSLHVISSQIWVFRSPTVLWKLNP